MTKEELAKDFRKSMWLAGITASAVLAIFLMGKIYPDVVTSGWLYITNLLL